MAQVSKYRYLLNQYPETVQKEQFRIICHISKRTARYLLQSGLVPCVQSGKKTRNYTIKMKDIVRYLERREIHPEKYKLPPGSYIVRLCNLVNNPAYVHLEDSGINAAIPILESVGVA